MQNPSTPAAQEEDMNIVALWLRKDPKRWIAGGVAGLVAGLISMAVAATLSATHGMDPTFAIRLLGLPIVGASATEYGNSTGLIAGFVFYEFLAMFWGALYGHFVATSHFKSLLAMGLVWGTFFWIFDFNLYAQSFKSVLAAQVPPGAAFVVCVTYGLSLSVIGLFDRRTLFI